MLKWYCFIVLYHINSVYKILCIFRITISTLLLTILVHWTVWEFFFFFFYSFEIFFPLGYISLGNVQTHCSVLNHLKLLFSMSLGQQICIKLKFFFFLFYRNLIFSLFYYLSVGIKFIQRSLASIPTPFSCVYSSMLHFEILYDCYEDALI